MKKKPIFRTILLQLLLTLPFFGIYYLIYISVQSSAIPLLSIVFVIVTAWFRGTLVGLIQCIFNYAVISTTIHLNAETLGIPQSRDAVIGFTMHIVFTLAAGYTGSLTRKLHKEIEERKRIEAQLHEHREQLEQRVEERTRELENITLKLHQAEKMETIGQLAGGIAHDFKNHLTIILGYTNLLARKLQNSTQESDFVRHILTSSEKASELTSNLLNFSRKERYKAEPLNINEIIEQTIPMFSKSLFSNISIECTTAPDLPEILGGKSQIQNALLNLALNSKDAISGNGAITIETSIVDVTEHFMEEYCITCKPGAFIGVTVSDNGSGISPEILPRIFEPFFTTKPEGKGTGMGLATIQGMTRRHKGDIFAVSEIGKGTSFTMLFPAIENPIHK